MRTLRCLLLGESVHHGNTARIAREMGDVLGAEWRSPAECPYDRLAGYELLGIGSGIYYGRIHDEVWHWASGLPESHARHLRVFIFTTSGLPILKTIWHRPLKRVLATKGYDVIGEFACRGCDTWGPLWLIGGLNRRHPDERDLARAAAFARRIRTAVEA